MDLGIAKFRIAKFSHCEIKIGSAKSILALRIFALRNFRIANVVLRKFSHCEIAFGIAKLALALRTAQYPAATVPLVLHPAACILLQLHLIFFTLPWFFF